MTPEEKARVKIDQMFRDAGWAVVDRDGYTPVLSAVAVREGLLRGNREADYFLFIEGVAVGILEAKRAEVDVASEAVCEQTAMYARIVPPCYKAYSKPLPLGYQSNGEATYWIDFRDPQGELQRIDRIHTPREVCRMLGINNLFAGLPVLSDKVKKDLRKCQVEAIDNLEQSFRMGQTRALMNLATGAGKTFTACLACYRLLSYSPMRRILFLVDRNNLGRQAENSFGRFRLTETGDPFNVIYGVERLRGTSIPTDSNVIISTIQRLFSFLRGDAIIDDDADEQEPSGPIVLPDNPKLPRNYFDLIIIDECHRSIYGNWRSVLEYFDTARLVGLTATPIPETKAFFNNNIIVNYTLEQSITDGVNVDNRIYRIRTQATESGGAIRQGDHLRVETRYTGKVENITQRETTSYTKEELNRSVINPAQIKLVLETYRDTVYSELFCDPPREPNMDYLPKTLIFALNEAHATNIERIAREVFGHPDEDDPFIQKITYSAGDSNALIHSFNIDKRFRIAVTCTLVATGTDVPPLEVLIFMRDVQSEPLYIQMRGRGTRVIGDDQLRNVTPNAISKDCFYLVDAVGVTEHAMGTPTPGSDDQHHSITLARLLELLAHGNLEDELLRLLAGKLARIYNKSNDEQRQHFITLAGICMKQLSANIYEAMEKGLPEYIDINQPNNERRGLVAHWSIGLPPVVTCSSWLPVSSPL